MRWVHDDDGANLRKGLRAAVVTPLLFYVLDPWLGSTGALYAAFGSFSALVFADFQGTARRVLAAYGVLAALGCGLVLAGSLSAETAWLAALAIFVVGFTIRFLGCLGGYAVASGTPMMLAFALAVLSVPVEDVGQRLAGWVIGVLVAGVAARAGALPTHLAARARLADQARAIAAHLRALAAGAAPPPLDPTPVRLAREELANSSAHPLDPTAPQTALRVANDALGRATLVASHLPPGPLDTADLGTDRVAEAAAAAFDQAAEALLRRSTVDVSPIHDVLVAHRAAVVAALDDDERRRGTEAAAGTSMRVRLVASLAALTGAASGVWAGHPPAPDQVEAGIELPRPGAAAFWHRSRQRLGVHLHWRTTRFQNSVRAGIALTASLVVARVIGFEHAFWVALGTLSVLRSGAADTTTTAIQALRGTLVGFAVAVPLALATDGSVPVLLVLLPFATFFAAWAPGAIGLGTGQAGFTVFVVVLFDLVSPAGADTAVVRLETVATGIAVAVVSGALFWPRGPEARLGPLTARLYRAAARSVQAVSTERLGLPGSTDATEHARLELASTRAQLEETLHELVAGRHAAVELADRVTLMTPPSLVRVGEWSRVDRAGGTVAVDEGAPSTPPRDLEALAFEVAAHFEAVAAELDDPDEPNRELVTSATPAPSADGLDGAQFLRQVWLWSWLSVVDQALVHTSRDIVDTVRSLPRSWWRR